MTTPQDPRTRQIPHALFATRITRHVQVHGSGSDRDLRHTNKSLRNNQMHTRLQTPFKNVGKLVGSTQSLITTTACSATNQPPDSLTTEIKPRTRAQVPSNHCTQQLPIQCRQTRRHHSNCTAAAKQLFDNKRSFTFVDAMPRRRIPPSETAKPHPHFFKHCVFETSRNDNVRCSTLVQNAFKTSLQSLNTATACSVPPPITATTLATEFKPLNQSPKS